MDQREYEGLIDILKEVSDGDYTSLGVQAMPKI